jgi:hypothetical protein
MHRRESERGKKKRRGGKEVHLFNLHVLLVVLKANIRGIQTDDSPSLPLLSSPFMNYPSLA